MEDDVTTQSNNKQLYDWSAHYDDEGKLFYYNSKTEESSWDPPEEGFNPPAATTENAQNDTAAEADDDADAPPPTEAPDDAQLTNSSGSEWEVVTNEDGTEYYHNTVTGETQWEKPEGFIGDDAEAPSTNEVDENQQSSPEEDLEPKEDNEEADVSNNSHHNNASVSKDGPKWTVHKDEDGAEYYCNAETGETQWEKPEGEILADSSELINEASAAVEDGTDHEAEEKETAETGGVKDEEDLSSKAPTSTNTGKWTVHQDEEGREFYYNAETEETQWDRPHDMDQPVAAADDDGDTTTDKTGVLNDNGAAVASQEGQQESNWVIYKDEQEREYYYNTVTGDTQWEKPDGAGATLDGEGRASGEDAIRSEFKTDDAAMDEEKEEVVEDEVVDPAVRRLQEAEAFLNKADSILEPDCFSNVAEVVASEGGNATKAMTALVENYQAQTAVCGLLARWLSTMRSSVSTSTVTTQEESSEATNDEIRKVAQDVINRVAKERFSKETGDRILYLGKSQAAFLVEMMDSSRWRKLLIDLSASHSDSAVLMYCLKTISERGHHREIARRINQSDHFAVFRQMMQSELTVIGTLAVSSGSDIETSIGMEELKNDLRRACTATSYTYLYSLEVLRALEQRSIAVESVQQRRAFRKWEVLREDLENTMQDPAISANFAGSSPLFRKRRLDIALTINELHQRQRRRFAPPSDASNQKHVLDGLESALLDFLRRYATGVQVDDSVLDPLLPSGLDSEESSKLVGLLLVKHPMAIRALMGCLFKPGTSRVTSTVLKNKCARLLALAVLAAESKLESSVAGEKSVEVAVHRLILQGAKLCEQLELMVSFLVTDGSTKSAVPSPGLLLCDLATKSAIVANGSIMWARELTQGSEFAGSASFPTLSVSILSLVRRIAMEQPFTRSEALAIALGFTKHFNSDVSYQKINAIKEQSIRLMLCLMTKGESSPVLASFAKRLQQQPEVDAALVRYFVAGVLEIVRVPVSLAFGRVLAQFLRAPKCVDAVRSSYFGEPHQTRLELLLKSFTKLVVGEDGRPAEKDKSWLDSLLATYQLKEPEGKHRIDGSASRKRFDVP
ncbi:hypothetical protein ACA910_003069 [Epithemia clementina (nom. ined.)]